MPKKGTLSPQPGAPAWAGFANAGGYGSWRAGSLPASSLLRRERRAALWLPNLLPQRNNANSPADLRGGSVPGIPHAGPGRWASPTRNGGKKAQEFEHRLKKLNRNSSFGKLDFFFTRDYPSHGDDRRIARTLGTARTRTPLPRGVGDRRSPGAGRTGCEAHNRNDKARQTFQP